MIKRVGDQDFYEGAREVRHISDAPGIQQWRNATDGNGLLSTTEQTLTPDSGDPIIGVEIKFISPADVLLLVAFAGTLFDDTGVDDRHDVIDQGEGRYSVTFETNPPSAVKYKLSAADAGAIALIKVKTREEAA